MNHNKMQNDCQQLFLTLNAMKHGIALDSLELAFLQLAEVFPDPGIKSVQETILVTKISLESLSTI